MNYLQGKYKVKNPQKYKGNVGSVQYRSSWELNVFNYMDRNPDVILWNSEEVVVPYRSPIDGRMHRYFVDIWMKNKKGDVYLIEIKPYAQTKPPIKKKRITKKYLNEVKTWGVNQAKWEAANDYCKKKDWSFQILTEKELFNKRL